MTVTLIPPDASPQRPPAPGEPVPDITARQLFIWALVGGILPCFGLPVVWTMAAIGWKKGAGSTQRSWRHALVALAILDTLVAGAAAHMAWTKAPGGKPVQAASLQPGRVLGVTMDPDYRGPGVKVLRVFERSPSAEAGLRVGDLVHRVNTTPLSAPRQLQELVRDTPAGSPVTLELERDGARWEVSVVPVEYRTFAPPPPKLFEPSKEPAPPHVSPGSSPRRGVGAPLVASGALLVLWLVGRKRGADTRALQVLGVLVLSLLGFAAAGWGLGKVLEGSTRGGMLLLRRAGPASPGEGAQSWVRTYFLSLGLLVTLAPRMGTVLVWLAQRVSAPIQDSQHPLVGLAEQGSMGALGWVLLAVPAALLAPVGEELLFRGLLLPWLSSWMGRVAALVASAALFASLHSFYGLFVLWIFFYGLVLGWARLHSGGVRAPILLHMTINSLALLMAARAIGS